MLWPAVEAWWSLHPSGIELRIKVKPEFCRYHHLSAKGSERFAYEFFIGKRPVYFSSVEECDAVLNGCANKSDHLLLVCGRPVREKIRGLVQFKRRSQQIVLCQFPTRFFHQAVERHSLIEKAALQRPRAGPHFAGNVFQ